MDEAFLSGNTVSKKWMTTFSGNTVSEKWTERFFQEKPFPKNGRSVSPEKAVSIEKIRRNRRISPQAIRV
jgi:hypothetical protein